jgi:hypothetical protein
MVTTYAERYVALTGFADVYNATFENDFFVFTSDVPGLFLGWGSTAGGLTIPQHEMLNNYLTSLA